MSALRKPHTISGFPSYPCNRESSIPWVEQIPKHWKEKRLKDICLLNQRKLPDDTHHLYELQYLDISNVNSDGKILDLQDYYFEDSPSRARRKVQDGETIISTVRTYLRAMAYIDKPHENLIVSTGFSVLTPKKEIHPRFLHRLVQAKEFVDRVVAHSDGVAYPAINPTQLSCLPVWVPPYEEQRSIVAFLDRETSRIDEMISKKRRLIELLEEKRTALISHAVTKGLNPNAPMKDSGIEWLGKIPEHWETRAIKHISCIQGRIGFRGYSKEDIVGEKEGAITLSPSNMALGKTNLQSCTFLSWKKYYESPEIMVEKNDILLVKTGSTYGKVAYVEGVDYPQTVNPQIMIIKVKNTSPKFLFYLISSKNLKETIRLLNTGSTIPTMTQESIGRLRITNPPILEQQEIIRFLDIGMGRIDVIISKNIKLIDKLQEHRTALISAAVTGKIDVREER